MLLWALKTELPRSSRCPRARLLRLLTDDATESEHWPSRPMKVWLQVPAASMVKSGFGIPVAANPRKEENWLEKAELSGVLAFPLMETLLHLVPNEQRMSLTNTEPSNR